MNMHIIWDLDGTLIDSSDVILEEVISVCNHFNININEKQLKTTLESQSISRYIKDLEKNCGLAENEIKSIFSANLIKRNKDLKLNNYAYEILVYLSELGIKCYVCTNKGKNTYEVLKELNIIHFFEDIITSNEVEQKKPSPEGILIILERYKIDPQSVYYIGDKPSDAEAANSAKVKSINLSVTTSDVNTRIDELIDIKKIIDKELGN
ncbi:HAD family hydrolase [Mollicutes bacterium LVI A0039]|nr:HAD family hydrolase [Mollicutes bacterium LVI A0039]